MYFKEKMECEIHIYQGYINAVIKLCFTQIGIENIQ